MIKKLFVFAFCCTALLLAFAAAAHPAKTSAVFLDMKTARTADVEIQMPLDQLRMALPQLNVEGNANVDENDELSAEAAQILHDYIAEHLSATLPNDVSVDVAVNDLAWQRIDDAPYIVAHASLTAPPDASLARFSLHYDAILHRVVTHKIYLSIRNDFDHAIFSDRPRLLDVIRFQHSTISIDRSSGSRWRGFAGMFTLGMQHIREGVDHLLFLFVLLLPAPLIFRIRHYALRPVADSVGEVVKIVSAFTCGHSITLLLGALGIAVLPSRPVEVLVAVSIVFSAMAAMWPQMNAKAWWVAGGFGLVHGLAFADALTGFGFRGPTLLLAVAGFNLGVETMQLLLVAAVLPLLLLLARTRFYIALRNVAAILATAVALLWIVDRLLPAFGIVDLLVAAIKAHALFTLAVTATILEIIAWRLYRLRKILNPVRSCHLHRSAVISPANNPVLAQPR